ncbi:hypothetical protein QR680_003215 [Steinernema hermaphroditum]|uniref:Exportin-4 n=1 Tax=Steinernema hermaphroditum TaxID=289476 RepID=A0AA39H7Q2_9BILA|nr:hypothetical protein QR680_003215 [Steinernema hermaphroditum]
MAAFNLEDIERLERAADVFLGDPSKVTKEQRREAESFFDTLQKSNLSLEQCLYIFEKTSSPFVIFQVSQCLGLAVFRDWAQLSDQTVHDAYQFLLKFAIDNPHLPPFAISELFKCSARIFKRGILDEQKKNSSSAIYSLIRSLITSESESYRILGCQVIEALAAEFSSSWGGSKYGLTWDFHIRAKRAFESNGLKELFSLALQIIGSLAQQPEYVYEADAVHVQLAQKFLGIANIVLSWNFSPKIVNSNLLFHGENHPSDTAFRPPEEWKDVVQNPEFVNLFFRLHSCVRRNDYLCTMSMQCIAQLATVMGEVMGGPPTIGEFHGFHDQYLNNYLTRFLETFENQPAEIEIVFVASSMYKLLTYHPLPLFFRLPTDMLRRWLSTITTRIITYTPIAVRGMLEDPTHTGYEALKLLYQTWAVVLQSKNTYYKKDIVNELLKSLIHQVDNDDEVNDDHEHEDDIIQFSDHLRQIGTFVSACPQTTVDVLATILHEKVSQLPTVYSSNDWNALRHWQEGIHWTLLVVGYSLTNEQVGAFIPANLVNYCLDSAAKRGTATPLDGKNFIQQCIDNPEQLVLNPNLEPIISVFGHLLSLCSLQYHVLTRGGIGGLSPTVLRSTLWATRRMISALTARDEEGNDPIMAPSSEYYSILQLVMMEKGSEISLVVVNFFLNFCFDIIDKMSGETKVCEEAIMTLLNVADGRPQEVAGNDIFYDKLGTVKLEKVNSRRLLVSSLVAIGSMCDEPHHHDRMANMILKPLAERYHHLVQTGGNFSDIVDLLECFCGVAEAAQSFTANILLNYLFPILELCPQVLNGAKHEQAVVDSVLRLFAEVTKHLIIFIDEIEVTRKVYNIVAVLMEVYRDTQLGKYKSHLVDEEEQSSDLIYFLDVVTNILSKDIFNSAEPGSISDGVKISLLEFNMLLPLMDKTLLRMPAICSRFFKFILYMTELYPETFSYVEEETVVMLFPIMKAVLTSEYGTEVMVNCIESIGHIAQYFLRPNVTKVDFITNRLAELLPDVFTITMQNGAQLEIFKNGTTTLFNIICCAQEGFTTYVRHLIEMQRSPEVSNNVATAFEELMSDFDGSCNRRQLRIFRDKFETFLARVKGQLCLFH